ncbi:cytochrome b [Dysgonomonas hofstadii]|uniref:Cytochrome b n=1 Tax=Dysgonomonas hofstadii TaxID=637886 RepID=A0A840CH16_9BACT|nr:hypothetical protein [Dysgonomonas hofstadii]MBB4035287.1 cytochrome b [Dysgonomonas hofstadii]
MKDTVITSKRKRTEIITWLICFFIANLINLYAVIVYDNTLFSELFTSLGYVFVASVAIYLVWTAIRVLFYGLKSAFKTKK